MNRKEATLEEWKSLYHLATLLGEMKPWIDFWDVDLIALSFPDSEPVFVSILGKGEQTYGISIYEGNDGLLRFRQLLTAGDNPFIGRYIMLEQECLNCYWGNRDELNADHYRVIKDLGYKYRGKNKWLYFVSMKPGYFPYQLDQEEVKRLTQYYATLIDAIETYRNEAISVDFTNSKVYWYGFDEKLQAWKGNDAPLPEVSESVPIIELSNNPALSAQLKKLSKSGLDLQIDALHLSASIDDTIYVRPVLPQILLVVDTNSGLILESVLLEPENDSLIGFVNELTEYFIKTGIPKAITVRHEIFAAVISSLADELGIDLYQSDYLPALDDVAEMLLDQFGS